MCWITEDVCIAVTEAAEIEAMGVLQGINYKEHMCCKKIKSSYRSDVLIKSLQNGRPYGLSFQDEKWYKSLANKWDYAVCCLPNGHAGRCEKNYTKYFMERYSVKLGDCLQAPGADDIIFKNRTRRTYAVIVERAQESIIRQQYEMKSKAKTKAAIPSEQASSPFLCATAALDFAGLLTLQYDPTGVYSKNKLDPRTMEAIKEHGKKLIKAYKENYSMHIVDGDGFLCDPFTLKKHLPEYWTSVDRKSPHQIQFGHIAPIRANKFMTRGMNVFPLTRETNIRQGDRSFSEFFLEIIEIAAKASTVWEQ